jgi:hypothetical protein
MKVARIGHASLVISTARMRVIMDPILIDPFDSRSTVFDPPVRIDAGVLTGVDLVVLSHQHMDHFCVESLNAIERHRPVVYPREATLIADALRRLGFHHPVPVDHAEVIDIGGLRLCGVMNPVDRTEMGFVFAAEGHVVWNQVDTWYDHSTYRQLAPLIGPVDLLIAPYQPMVELPLSEGPLGTDFPYQDYARLLGNVLAVAPRFVVPGSCGSSFVGGRWLDSRCFGATEPQFLADLARLSPGLRGASLPPAAELDLSDDFGIRYDVVPGVRRQTKANYPSHEWRPDLGIPPLVDLDPQRLGVEALRGRVHKYLEETLTAAMSGDDQRAWREELTRLGQRLFRSDEARQRDPRGSGLGLSITSALCDRCGWTLAFANLAPHGLEVTLRGSTGAQHLDERVAP